jgi:hypothetical protein
MSTPPFAFATLTRTYTSAGEAPPSAAAAAPAAGAGAPEAAPSVPNTRWPQWMLDSVARHRAQSQLPDDYELKMSDIEDGDISRFRLELAGRSYAANWPYDRELDVWRNVFLSYPETVRMGLSPVNPGHHSGIFWRDIKRAREDIELLRTAPDHPPTLQRWPAELGHN